MALPIISPSNFEGWIKISADTFQQDKLQQYIDLFEETYFIFFLGAEATKEIIDTASLPEKWADILGGVYYHNIEYDALMKLNGLTNKVKQCIYFEYVRDNFISTSTGKNRNLNENANRLSTHEVNAVARSRYNNSIDYNNRELTQYLTNYIDFEQPIIGFIDNGGDSYTIQTNATKYLADGDTVKIKNEEFTISNLVDNTSFDIVSPETSSFEGVYLSNPYSIVPLTVKDAILF
ncbi:MAG: hypothetical protein ACYTKD_31110 [Planctomycetota bacterium]|jgi:hypothetical protein